MDFIKLFKLAMKRNIPYIVDIDSGLHLNLGAGETAIGNAFNLDYPKWDADSDPIPYGDNSVSLIHAYHFLEHCENPVKVLQECQRVLVPRGCMNICVPYYSAAINAQDLDHKHSFTEETWKTLFKNQYYDKNQVIWKFEVGFNLICGVVERNLCLLTQLIKMED